MQKAHEDIVSSFIDNKVGLSQRFLSHALSSHLRDNLKFLNNSKQLAEAGIGNLTKLTTDLLVRSQP